MHRPHAADGRRRRSFHRRGGEVGEMVHRERGGVVAGRARPPDAGCGCGWPRSEPLNCVVVTVVWQLVHWVFTSIAPVCQLGVACPPWQLTFEQLSAAELSNDDDPDCALYVARNSTSPGGTRDLGAVVMVQVQEAGPQPVVAGIAGDRAPRAVQGDVRGMRPGDVRIRRPRTAVRRAGVAGGAVGGRQRRGRDVARLANGPDLRRRRGDVVAGAACSPGTWRWSRVMGVVVERDRVRAPRPLRGTACC